jgi:hypothetical protein
MAIFMDILERFGLSASAHILLYIENMNHRIWIRAAARLCHRGGVVALVLLVASGCGRSTSLSTDDMVGEWQKQGNSLPPISLLITSEGSGLRARLRLSGAEAHANAIVHGRMLRLEFDQKRADLQGEFVSKNELDLRFQPGRETYRLRKRP